MTTWTCKTTPATPCSLVLDMYTDRKTLSALPNECPNLDNQVYQIPTKLFD